MSARATSWAHLRRIGRGSFALVDSRHTVAIAALVAVTLRLPGLTRPIRADEAGFLMVARAWQPRPDSMYGPYFVDRPPLLIAVVRAADWIGGPLFIRVVGALAAGLLVLASAYVARHVAGDRAARWTAVAVAALVTNVLVDSVAVKGELLALPLIMGSFGLTLLALERGSSRLAAAAGLLATLALGLKQNLVAGLVFGGVLLVASWLVRRITLRELARLGAAAALGASVPVVATIAWAWASGVRLSTLGYAVVGFRADATRVITGSESEALEARALVLVAAALGAGLVLIIGGFLVHLRDEWRQDPPITAAILAVLAVDLTGLTAGGSYWRDYLFPLVPGAALCTAMLARRSSRRGIAMRGVVVAAVVSSTLAMVAWIGLAVTGRQAFTEANTGAAIGAVADPGDTLTVFGGRADLQLASGLDSPYRFLWSLPMRTLDPQYAELRALVNGPDAPTWFVEWVPFGSWGNPAGVTLQQAVESAYDLHGLGCADRPVYLRKGIARPPLAPDCVADPLVN